MRIIEEDQALTPEELIAQQTQAKPQHVGKLLDKSLLPSRGTFYTDDIYVTPFTGMDLKDITNIIDNNANGVIFKILSRRITGIDVTKILANDKLWFLYYIRDITYNGKPIQVKCTCPVCGAQTVQEYTFDKLNIVHYDKKLPSKQIKMPNDDLIEFTFPTIGTENAIARLKNNPALFEPIDDQFMLLASYVKSINGKQLDLMSAYDYVKNADAPTFCFIIHKLDEYSFICDRTATFTCTCGEEIRQVIELDQNFFIPKLF